MRANPPPLGTRRRARVAVLVVAGCLALASLGRPAAAQIDGIGEPPDPGPTFPVSHFVVRYRSPHPDQPALDEILPVSVGLGVISSGLIRPSPDRPSREIRVGEPGETLSYHPGAIGSVSAGVLAALQARGLLGVYVEPDPAEIDVANERDLRAPGDTQMTLLVSIAQVRRVRTVASGDRIDTEWRIDNRVHERIRRRSPIQPAGGAGAGDESTDLVDAGRLDDYLFRLNRHPGRRVDAALAPADDGAGVSLDFLVTEAKPWYLYAQVSNTGTESGGEWQQRFGFVHNQLLDRDDVFTLEYVRSGWNQSNGVNFEYEAPWFEAERPWWWSRPEEGPDWLAWWDRSKWPWFGNELLRWSVRGHYLDYETQIDLDPSNPGKEKIDGVDWLLGARLIYNVFQYRAFFVDVYLGVDGRGVVVDNNAALVSASRAFLLPHVGLDAERVTPISTLFANLTFEGNVVSARTRSLEEGDNPAGGIEALGRTEPDDRWFVLHGQLGATHYLEPLLNPRAWQDPTTQRSSTLAHEIAVGARGQYAFGYRLIPQATQVIGGLYSVRGYEQSSASGDNVVVGSLEYRFHVPHALPIAREPMQLPLLGDFRASPQQVYGRADWDLILRAFVDAGYSSSNDRPESNLERSEFLVGSGVGAELVFRNNLRARLDYGVALQDSKSTTNPVDAGDDAFHLLFTVLY